MDVYRSEDLPRGCAHFEAAVDLPAIPEEAFALLCAVEKWPAWLPLVRSAQRQLGAGPLALGDEVLLRLGEPRDEEQLFEVRRLVGNYCLTLVGAYSTRRRIDFRLERQSNRARLRVAWLYPTYHGAMGSALDHLLRGRAVAAMLDRATMQFRGLLEASLVS
ncbi:MAG: hypothetical protein PXZ07_03305 [Candidatus Eremiobacteraeota bacterium]|nr:hypothetical protein [Candidatus Eremiobacteraeota bacterium]